MNDQFYQEEEHDNPMKWQEIYNQKEEINNNIKE